MRKLLVAILLFISTIASGQMMLPGVVASSRYVETSTLNNGLIARWDFDESTGTTAAESVNGHDATLYGSIGHSTDAVTGYALDFSGSTGQYGSAANHADFQVSTTISVSFWIKLDAALPVGYTYFITYSTSGSPYQAMHTYYDADGTLFFAVYNTSGTKYYARSNYGYTLSTGVWYHIVGVCPGTGSAMRLYVNGAIPPNGNSTTLTGTIYQFTSSVFLNVSANTFDGRMDNVRIYNRELTTAEISELYDELP